MHGYANPARFLKLARPATAWCLWPGLLLVFAGVIGGLLAFGLIGVFLGPTILAVGYTLLGAWVAEGDADAL